MTTPSPAEYALQAIVNEMDSVEFYDLLENCCLTGAIDKDQLDALHQEYPSILSTQQYQSLLHHFEE